MSVDQRPLKLRVEREACCSQDDQIGPLEASYDLRAGATIKDLVDAVVKSGFLQFSSTHTTMVGKLGNTDVVRVTGSLLTRPFFISGAEERLGESSGALRFRFVFDT
jgi:hypothetical protein